MTLDARARRLAVDAAAIRDLETRHPGTFGILGTQGTPPDRWLLTLSVPAICQPVQADPVLRDQHRLEIRLPSTYPLAAPVVTILSPIWHPHVFANGTVCLGARWLTGEGLGNMLVRLHGILRGDPDLFDFDSPANPDAAEWYETHLGRFPLAPALEEAKATESAPPPRVEWRES